MLNKHSYTATRTYYWSCWWSNNDCVWSPRGGWSRVLGPSTEYAGYNVQGQYFSSPTSARVFSGITFDDGSNIVILSEREAKNHMKTGCQKLNNLSKLKRSQLGGAISNVADCMSKLVVYGAYKKYNGAIAEAVDVGESYFGFIEDVLNEYTALSTLEEKTEYKLTWDLMAHGYDDNSLKWKQAKFNNIPVEVKESFDSDVNAALLCRLVKDAIFCFDNNVTEVDKGHTHYFNSVLNKVEELATEERKSM